MLTDPIADLLTRIRNAGSARHERVECPSSKIKVRIAEVLREQGYIRDFAVREDGKQGLIDIEMKYLSTGGTNNAITGIKRVSRPGCRVYVQHTRLPRVLGGMGVAILSTSRGVMTDREARKQRVGGEYLCAVW